VLCSVLVTAGFEVFHKRTLVARTQTTANPRVAIELITPPADIETTSITAETPKVANSRLSHPCQAGNTLCLNTGITELPSMTATPKPAPAYATSSMSHRSRTMAGSEPSPPRRKSP
jgi:hypothetical protein